MFRLKYRFRVGYRFRFRFRFGFKFRFGSGVLRWGCIAGRWCVNLTVQLY